MKRLGFLVLFVLALIACSSATHTEPPASEPPPAPVQVYNVCFHVDPGAPEDELRAGVDGWRYSTQGWRAWGYGSPCHLIFTEVDEGAICSLTASACTRIGGLMKPNPTAVVWLVRGEWEHGARYIAMHEIGHALGLGHDEGGIMGAHAGLILFEAEWQCPDAVTITRLEWQTGTRLKSCVMPLPAAVRMSVDPG